ncbi:MAG: Stk1 family PASTA domain-containing Ser/Thr kinase [Defluviitaleaceae bacterium]|nr:Stk1 family PASTA domain-containing Ser/Thr kinase [Defluviitaleaceae bacterium]
MRLEQGKVISDRYEIQEQLGSGGMAIVYRALDLKLDRFVTLKVMREDLEEGFIERFYKEAQSVASLSHTNIVKVYDYGEDSGIHYIVMEYVDGTTLKDLIVKKAPFDEESTLGVAVQIASGLLHAHKNDVIHRDIKPQNILVTHDGSVKIADFGIARAAKVSTLTSNANSMGSVHYFSPEQARGGFVDHKSDIYSLGVTMFEMATGKLPYNGETAVAIALKHINDPFPNPQELNTDISDNLKHIIDKSTEKSSNRRYVAIEDMYRDMKKTINNVDLDTPSFEDSPTVVISKEDREAIRKQEQSYKAKMRNNPQKNNTQKSTEDEYGPYDDKNNNRKVMIAAFSTAAVFIAIITMASFLIFNHFRPVHPPDIVGLTVDHAMQIAQPLNLDVATIAREYSEEYEAGIIMHQQPSPDRTLPRGESIHVVVSRGSAFFPMPNVINDLATDVTNHLQTLVFEIIEESYNDVNLPAGLVIQTIPPAGTLISHEQTVTIYVSLGPDNSHFPMPNLWAMSETMAVEKLQDLGLIVGHITRSPSPFYTEGSIFGQSISPGEEVMAGDIVELTISTGVTIPTPTPTPTPAPTPTPTPEPADPPATITASDTSSAVVTTQVRHSTLSIALWEISTETESVHLRVYKRPEGGALNMIVNYPVNIGQFPLPLPISGTGRAEYLVFSVDENGAETLRSRTNVDFTLPNV